jgi:hypothetical protein
VLPGDPGPQAQFHDAVYERGAMALQTLRATVGDEAFFAILRTWAAEHKDGHRDHGAVRRAGGADLGCPAGRPVHDLALHQGKAPDGPGRCPGDDALHDDETEVLLPDRADGRPTGDAAQRMALMSR